MTNERKLIQKEVGTFGPEFCTLKEVLATIKYLIAEHGEDAKIIEGTYPYSDGTYLAVVAKVLETDKEMAERIAVETAATTVQLDRERKEYERLKAKFAFKS